MAMLLPLALAVASAPAAPGFSSSFVLPPDDLMPSCAAPAPRKAALHPTLGFPALARPGESAEVYLASDCLASGVTGTLAARFGGSSVEVDAGPLGGCRPVDPAGRLARCTLHVPADILAGTYDLLLDGLAGSEPHRMLPSAVRVHRSGEDYSFVVLADLQVPDPTGNFGYYELWQDGSRHRVDNIGWGGFSDQVFDEIRFQDPLFVLLVGDIVFGMHYQREYTAARTKLHSSRLAIFSVPGNHDGYALVELDEALSSLDLPGVVASMFNGRFKLGDLTRLLGPASYPDLKDFVTADGLSYYQTYFGPLNYTFTYGDTAFIGLNTYQGPPSRRLAIPSPGFDILQVGAPLSYNYGGYLEGSGLRWLQGNLENARAAGQQAVVFGHHDPGGNIQLGDVRYSRDVPFAETALSDMTMEFASFDGWNYASARSGGPGDGESAEQNSGTTLLSMLGQSQAWFFCGHTHRDAAFNFDTPAGPARVVETTTALAGPEGDHPFRGYRVVRVEDGAIASIDFTSSPHRGSVEAGRLHVRTSGGPGHWVVFNEHDRSIGGVLVAALSAEPNGFDAFCPGATCILSDIMLQGAEAIAKVHLDIPAAPSRGAPGSQGNVPGVRVSLEPSETNQPPTASIAVDTPRVRQGEVVTFSADGSVDPEGEPLLRVVWDIGGARREGSQVRYAFQQLGLQEIGVTVYDAHGAIATHSVAVEVEEPGLGLEGADLLVILTVLLGLAVLLGLGLALRNRSASRP